MEIEICKPTPEQAELQKLFAEVPSKESIERATYILNEYSKDSHADIQCLALAIDRRLREYKQHKDILDKILREFPVGNITEHTIESLPERLSYYLKELAEYTQKVEAWEKCADDLVDYAHGFVSHLSTWGKGYDRHDKDIKQAEDAIEMYTNLKNEC
jgi:iron-sulfur cluster repair protein YtfE (RIC family)